MPKLKKGLVSGFIYAIEILVIVISLFPILWVILSAFKTNGEILSSPLDLPQSVSFDVFIHLFQNYNFPRYFLNSLLAAGVSTIVSLLFYAMGGYVLAKYKFPGRTLLFTLFTITLLVPAHSIFSILYQIWGFITTSGELLLCICLLAWQCLSLS